LLVGDSSVEQLKTLKNEVQDSLASKPIKEIYGLGNNNDSNTHMCDGYRIHQAQKENEW